MQKSQSNIDLQFCTHFRIMMNYIHQWAKDKGFWKRNQNLGEKLALVHSEISEALEILRKDPKAKDKNCPQFTNWEIELADAVIRIMDLAAGTKANLPLAIIAKMEYNESRPHKHGKLF